MTVLSAPPVLLVHGFTSSFEHGWRRTGWADLLKDQGRQVVGVDLPGHGTSGRSSDAAAYRDVEGTVASAISGHGVLDAAGFSAGAGILLRLAARGGAEFRRLVLMGVGDGLLGEQDATALAESLEKETPDLSDVTARLFHRMARDQGNEPAALAAFLRRRVEPLTEGEVRGVRCPVLFLIGDRDPVGVPERLAALLPDAQVRVLSGSDHFATPTDPRAVEAALRFLSR